MRKIILLALIIASIAVPLSAQAASEENTLTVYAYDSFSGDWGPAGKLIPMFEEKTGIDVELVGAGDAVEMLSRKCDMLKSESGQNAASRGELPSASSSGTAISMLQAAGSKRTNLHQAAINQAFLTMVRQVVSNLAAYGSRDESYRTQEGYAVLGAGDAAGAWEFDLQARLQQLPKYESVYQNQLLMQLLQMGVLPARAAFGLMDLSNKEALLKALEQAETERKEEENGGKTTGGSGGAGPV